VVRSIVIAAALVAAAATPALAQGAAAGDPAAGEKAFVVCRACHQIGPNAKNAVGPELNGVVGRKAGTAPGYEYSAANKNSGITWSADELRPYLANPQAVVKGTKMVFPGFHGADADKKISDVIAYLSQFDADGKKKGS
jgi:cytochrome c